MSLFKKIFLNYLFTFLFVWGCTNYSYAQTPVSNEYQIKAAFLFNFTQFVEWPNTSFATSNEPLVIGILGKNPFGSYLNEIITGEVVNGHPLVIRYYPTASELQYCHILYINKSEIDNLKQITEKLKGQSTLTISDANNFLNSGGMVELFTRDKKIKIKINLEDAKEKKLTISTKLLRLAEIFVLIKKDK